VSARMSGPANSWPPFWQVAKGPLPVLRPSRCWMGRPGRPTGGCLRQPASAAAAAAAAVVSLTLCLAGVAAAGAALPRGLTRSVPVQPAAGGGGGGGAGAAGGQPGRRAACCCCRGGQVRCCAVLTQGVCPTSSQSKEGGVGEECLDVKGLGKGDAGAGWQSTA